MWDRYDRLSDPERVGLGVAAVLMLAASSMYCLGAASLIALNRSPPSASAEAPPTASPLPVATEVNPISPLLAERTPTLRPTATATPAGRRPGTPTATVRPGAAIASATPTRRPGGTASPTALRTTSPTPTRTASPTPTRAVR